MIELWYRISGRISSPVSLFLFRITALYSSRWLVPEEPGICIWHCEASRGIHVLKCDQECICLGTMYKCHNQGIKPELQCSGQHVQSELQSRGSWWWWMKQEDRIYDRYNSQQIKIRFWCQYNGRKTQRPKDELIVPFYKSSGYHSRILVSLRRSEDLFKYFLAISG